MSLWQFAACMDGWNRANGGEEKPEAMSVAEFDALSERNSDWIEQNRK